MMLHIRSYIAAAIIIRSEHLPHHTVALYTYQAYIFVTLIFI